MSGMSKAESWMRKFGWEPGMVLGKNQEGLKRPLTVQKKEDTRGVGFSKTGKTFEWWANVYNNAATSVKVVKPKSVYGDKFEAGGVQHPTEDGVDFVVDEDPPQVDSHEEGLFEACEGRTLRAHKPTGKLARLAEQDKEFRAKRSKGEVEIPNSDESDEPKKEKKEKREKKEKKSKKEKKRAKEVAKDVEEAEDT